MRHGGNTNISKECGLNMLVIALQENGSEGEEIHPFFFLGTCKVDSGVLGPVDNGRFCID